MNDKLLRIKNFLHDIKIFLHYAVNNSFFIVKNDMKDFRKTWHDIVLNLKKIKHFLSSELMIILFMVSIGFYFFLIKKNSSIILIVIGIIIIHYHKIYRSGVHRGWERKRRYERYKKEALESNNSVGKKEDTSDY